MRLNSVYERSYTVLKTMAFYLLAMDGSRTVLLPVSVGDSHPDLFKPLDL
jgi:hypothetical protein